MAAAANILVLEDGPAVNNGTLGSPNVDRCAIITADVYRQDGALLENSGRILIREDAIAAESEGVGAYLLRDEPQTTGFGEVVPGFRIRRMMMLMPTTAGLRPVCAWILTGERFAIKISYWDRIGENNRRHADCPIREASVMQYLSRAAVEGEFSDIGRDNVNLGEDFFVNEDALFVVSLHFEGNLLYSMPFSEEKAKNYTRQILRGIFFVNVRGICHRDISPENILVLEDNIRLIDLGMSLLIPRNHEGHREMIRHQQDFPIGKWPYIAPELWYNRFPRFAPTNWDTSGFDGFAVDLWAIGVVLFVMLTRELPFSRVEDAINFIRNITARNITADEGYWRRRLADKNVVLSDEGLDFLTRMLQHNREDRLSLEQAVFHPWLQDDDGAEIPDVENDDPLDELEDY